MMEDTGERENKENRADTSLLLKTQNLELKEHLNFILEKQTTFMMISNPSEKLSLPPTPLPTPVLIQNSQAVSWDDKKMTPEEQKRWYADQMAFQQTWWKNPGTFDNLGVHGHMMFASGPLFSASSQAREEKHYWEDFV